MDVEESLRSLLYRIESCLKCYEKFKDYNEKDRIRIREWCNEGPWFFPPSEDSGIKGFLGTGKVTFVCQRPSTRGKIPNKADLLFYELMKKYGFEDAHITDLVKCRGIAGEISTREIDNCLLYLEEEIRILKPKLIIAVGRKVYEVLTEKLELGSMRVEKITHYSYAFRYNRAEKLEEEFRRIREIYRSSARNCFLSLERYPFFDIRGSR